MASQAALELLISMKGDAEKGLSSLGGTLKSLGGVALGVAAGGIAAIGATLISSIGDARESAKIFAQTEAVIKSTGGAAGVSARQVADYASSLSAASGKSLFGDEQIAQSENLLLTFTSIKGKALEAATAMSVDMAQAMGGEPKDAAIQLGKALNDPIKGITALSRVGVAFTDEQKAQIKAMQEAGNMAGAQAIILKELNTEFGGSALAAAKADGGVAQFWDSIGEAKEKLGGLFLPMLGQAVALLNTSVIPAFNAVIDGVGKFITAFQVGASDGAGFIAGFTNALYSLGGISPIFDTVADAINTITDALLDTGPLSSEFGEALGYVAQQLGLSAPLVDILEQGIFAVQRVFQSLLDTFTSADTPFQGVLDVLSRISPGFMILRGMVEMALPKIQALVVMVGTDLVAGFQVVFGYIQSNIMPVIHNLATAVMPLLSAAVQILAGLWTDVLKPALMLAWDIFTQYLMPVIAELAKWLSVVLPPAIQQVADYVTGTLLPSVHTAFDWIRANVLPILAEVVAWLRDHLPPVIATLAQFWVNTLLPAMLAVFNFTNDYIVPILMTLVTWLGTNIPPAIDTAVKMWEILKVSLASFKESYIDPVVRGFERVMEVVGTVRAKIDEFVALLPTVQIPDWLQGHSPPPLANWLSAVADAANDVTGAASSIKLPGLGGALPAVGGAGFAPSGGGGVTITVGSIVVQGSADADKTAEAVRAKLLELGKRNLNIFGGLA